MNLAVRVPAMSREAFLDWAERQEVRYEFDGWRPVAMTGGNLDHSRICQNLWFLLRTRLQGSGCESLGPDAGVATVGNAVRYPDALVTCTLERGDAKLAPGVVVVFEVLGPTSGRVDRIEKVREYAAVESIRRYVVIERTSAGLTSFERGAASEGWRATTLVGGETLVLPEIGIELPVSALYEGVSLPDDDQQRVEQGA